MNNNPEPPFGYRQQQLPPREQVTNVDPREQSWQGGQQQQYYGEQGPFPEKISTQYRRQRPRRRRGPIFWIVMAVILVFAISGIASIVGAAFGFGLGPGNSTTETQTLAVGGKPTVQVTDDVGTINVHRGDSGHVKVDATKHSGFGGNLNDINVNYKQDGNTIVITINRTGGNLFNSGSVDFNIAMPENADLNLSSNTGSVDVTGISGQMTLKSNTGSIDATQDSLHGDSALSTNTGSVTYEGAIDTTGAYTFTSNTGSVNVTFTGDPSFQVQAKSDTGSFNSDFSGINVQHDGAGSRASGNVGTNPQAQVTLTTNTGSINLNKSS